MFQKATTEKSKKVVLLLAMLMQQVEVAFAALVGALVGGRIGHTKTGVLAVAFCVAWGCTLIVAACLAHALGIDRNFVAAASFVVGNFQDVLGQTQAPNGGARHRCGHGPYHRLVAPFFGLNIATEDFFVVAFVVASCRWWGPLLGRIYAVPLVYCCRTTTK